MALRGGDIFNQPVPRPVSLPRFDLTDLDAEAEAREAAAKIAERRVIRKGLDALAAIAKAESFEG